MDFLFSHILTIMIFAPLFCGIVLLLLPINQNLSRIVSFACFMFIMVLGLYLFFAFDTNTSATQFKEAYTLSEEYGVSFMVSIDGVNLMILIAISCSFPFLFMIFKQRKKGYWANMLLIQSAFLAVIFADDLIFFYAGWEAMLIPVFILIGHYSKETGKADAAMKMMYYTMFGSLIMLFAILYLGVAHYNQFGFYNFSIDHISKVQLSPEESFWLFLSFMLAFVIKAPLFPFHTWMPEAYVKANIGATFVLSAIASKVAIYAILRFVLPIFPQSFVNLSPYFIALGIFSMIYFGIVAISQRDIKRMLAYSSASHIGLILASIFALNVYAMAGGIYQIVSHAIVTGIMFLLANMIQNQLNTRNTQDLGGLAKSAPIFSIIFGIAIVSSAGLPGTNGFISELLMILGILHNNIIFGILASSSVIIGATYLFLLSRRVLMQKQNNLTKNFKDLSIKNTIVMMPIVALIFIMGLYPKPFLKRIEPAIQKQYELYIHKYKDKTNK